MIMETKILTQEQIKEAAEILKAGELLAFPTETVYGLGAISNSKEAFEKLVQVKKRPPEKPFTLMCGSLPQAFEYCHLDKAAKAVMEAFMPGEITVLVKAKEGLPPWITLGSETIGIRVPDSKYVSALIKEVGCPLLVPSANKSGEPTSNSFEMSKEAFDGEIARIVMGQCLSKKASTIVNLSKAGEISLVREGPIPFDIIKHCWEENRI